MALLDDIGMYLAQSGLGEIGKTIWLGRYPDNPGESLSLHSRPGQMPERTMEHAGAAYLRSRLSVVQRALHQRTAMTRCWMAFEAMSLISNLQLGGSYYLLCTPMNEPEERGVDKNDLVLIGFDVELMRRLSPFAL